MSFSKTLFNVGSTDIDLKLSASDFSPPLNEAVTFANLNIFGYVPARMYKVTFFVCQSHGMI